ncbi:MAG TPA: sugar ABC transporter ATP-binding protein [Tepidisphaeraceae bacterium]|jgi:ribose transport system ATP-binding protein
MPDNPATLLEMRGVTKRFPGVVALDGVSIELARGELLALMGENGAGKSTLMKVLGGAYAPDGGEIRIDGETVALRNIADAKRRGIALIHQELMLAANLDIAANIFLGTERQKLGVLDRGAMNAAARDLLARVGLSVRPTTPVSALTVGQMQMVEIAKALSFNARLIIMDEPTSSLTAGESHQLFEIIRALKRDGIGIIYISHRMEEVLDLADRITVMRDGKRVGDLSRAEATHDKIVAMMVGRTLSTRFPDRPANPGGAEVLRVDDVLVPGARVGVSFGARAGEVLGFAGLVGSGRTELMQVIFGATAALGGSMTLDRRAFNPRRTADAIERGVYLAPEDRKRHGLVLPMTIAQNISLPDLHNYKPAVWLNRGAERKAATIEVDRMRIKTPSIFRKVVNLSGGNQQKVVLGKWLAMRPRVLILDEPTRGIDVGAKAEIYRHIATLAEQGIAVIMVSSDMEEILGMSDRVVVMHERRITGILSRDLLTPERIGSMMSGKASDAA